VSRPILFAALAALAVGVHAGGPRVFALLAYERSSILDGEVWRLLTTYLVHAGLGHLLWNVSATAVVALAVARALSARRWLAAALVVALGSSLGVLLLQPGVRAMAGLSGLLHGLLAAGAAAEVRRGERLAWVFLGLLAAKIAWELLAGPTSLGAATVGERVAVGAHACGALAGLLAGLTLPVSASASAERPSPPPAPPGR
jgi:rhomboid family GlyGly-CTERM serine protease